MKFILGGYYLVQGREREEWMGEDIMPPIIWSISKCVCDTYPGYWIMTYREGEPPDAELERKRTILELSRDDFAALRARFSKLNKEGEFGFPNVFLNIDLARDFYDRYLRHISDIKLLSIAIPETYMAKEITDKALEKLADVRKKLREGKEVKPDAAFRGYDVLGHDYSSFHSFICSGLQREYHEKLGIQFNQYGLIDSYEDARSAAEYTMLHGLGEPLFYCPWLISEHPLEIE